MKAMGDYLSGPHLVHVLAGGPELCEEERDGMTVVLLGTVRPMGCRHSAAAAAGSIDERAELAREVDERVSYGVADLADADGLEHARVAELLEHHAHLIGHGPLAVVGLDAAHEPRLALAHLLDEARQRLVELGSDRGSPGPHRHEPTGLEAAPLALAVLAQVPEHLGQQRVATVDEHVDHVGAKQVAVLVQEVLDLVDDLAGVVADDKYSLASARLSVQRARSAVHKVALF